ncbi:TIGR03619 family F420-dependent LLM class oxidoreductase [Actinomadura scrupuli]|uniref:TIGR03619 family F420-dependent LLM class oxidoreductase n=1 Tax=Actinomadura scrupuli TaxID=559629 RepID=UPI003D97C2CF
MRLGITMIATDRAMPAHLLAREAEDRGFASLYLPEHTHIPVARTTPSPAGPGAGATWQASYLKGTSGDETLAEDYARMVDPLIALAAAAAVTSRITLGTGVCLPAQREPIVTAKAVATLDQISGGRFVLGIGYGWNVEEAAHHGVSWAHRRAVVRENVQAMRALWTQEQARYKGEYVGFDASWAWPKPAGRVPVLIGGAAGPKLFAAIADYADGWLPIGGAGIREALPRLAQAYESAGRDPATATVVPFGTLPNAAKLDYYASLGIEEVVLRLPGGGRDQVLPVLDEYVATYLN